ncbi:hypothetical protein [Streptomyces sp. NPDC008125]|uniref:hypothetical protein n=1 Tax=Streptomyces sp. NPDC008125 TaxID=3364811 RepID=UPI0036E2F534
MSDDAWRGGFGGGNALGKTIARYDRVDLLRIDGFGDSELDHASPHSTSRC